MIKVELLDGSIITVPYVVEINAAVYNADKRQMREIIQCVECSLYKKNGHGICEGCQVCGECKPSEMTLAPPYYCEICGRKLSAKSEWWR